MSEASSLRAPGLGTPSEKQLASLATVLWNWEPCHHAEPNQCRDDDCPNRRIARFRPFTAHYKLLTLSYSPGNDPPALRSHDDLHSLIAALRRSPDLKKSQIARERFQDGRSDSGDKDRSDEECAMNLALTVMTMINCISQGTSAVLLEDGSNRTPWRWEVSPSQYIALVLPRRNSLPSRYGEEPLFLDTSSPLLMARELKRLAGMTFQGTSDITNHLRFDPINNVLSIFHHTSFLKEQLRLTKDCKADASAGDNLARGALPRQFILECLYSLQKILFPLWDSRSVTLLQSLVDRSSFDPDVLDCQDFSFINDDEEKIQFTYLGGRLAELYEEFQHPRPRGWLAVWLERRSGARYVMMATVAGVIFALFLGMAGLSLSAYQAWVTYQAWKQPVARP